MLLQEFTAVLPGFRRKALSSAAAMQIVCHPEDWGLRNPAHKEHELFCGFTLSEYFTLYLCYLTFIVDDFLSFAAVRLSFADLFVLVWKSVLTSSVLLQTSFVLIGSSTNFLIKLTAWTVSVIPCGLVARISGSHPGGPGSIPGMGIVFLKRGKNAYNHFMKWERENIVWHAFIFIRKKNDCKTPVCVGNGVISIFKMFDRRASSLHSREISWKSYLRWFMGACRALRVGLPVSRLLKSLLADFP